MIAWTASNRRAGRRAFNALWVGQSVSQLGTQVSFVVLPLIAAIVLNASPFETGLLAALETAPYLLASLPAGILADRVDRRRVLVLTDLGRAAVILAVPAAFALDMLSLPLLFVVALANGTLSVFFDIAYQSYVPRLVPPDRLVASNQRLELSNAGARVAGPALAGVLMSAVGAALTLLLDVLSYVLSAVAVLAAPAAARPQASPLAVPARTSLASGLRLVWSDRALRDLAASTATFNLASAAIFAVFVVFATREVGVDAAQFGLLYGLGNVGFLVGAVLVGAATRAVGIGRALFFAAALGTAATLVLPFAVGPFAILMLFAGRFVGAAAAAGFNVNAYSITQARVPDAWLGRVNATFRVLDWGALPVGSLLGGTVGTLLGLRAALVLAAVIGVASVLWLVRSPLRQIGALSASGSVSLAHAAGAASAPPPVVGASAAGRPD